MRRRCQVSIQPDFGLPLCCLYRSMVFDSIDVRGERSRVVKAPVCGTGDHGFEPRRSPQERPLTDHGAKFLSLPAPVAQWIEHWASDPGVAGSSPAGRATSSLLPFKATTQHVRRLTLWWQPQDSRPPRSTFAGSLCGSNLKNTSKPALRFCPSIRRCPHTGFVPP